jgi:hypothetical protein
VLELFVPRCTLRNDVCALFSLFAANGRELENSNSNVDIAWFGTVRLRRIRPGQTTVSAVGLRNIGQSNSSPGGLDPTEP